MNYAALIQNRKSVREFQNKTVPFKTLEQIKTYYQQSVRRRNCVIRRRTDC